MKLSKEQASVIKDALRQAGRVQKDLADAGDIQASAVNSWLQGHKSASPAKIAKMMPVVGMRFIPAHIVWEDGTPIEQSYSPTPVLPGLEGFAPEAASPAAGQEEPDGIVPENA